MVHLDSASKGQATNHIGNLEVCRSMLARNRRFPNANIIKPLYQKRRRGGSTPNIAKLSDLAVKAE